MAKLGLGELRKLMEEIIDEARSFMRICLNAENYAAGISSVSDALSSMGGDFDLLGESAKECLEYSQQISDKTHLMRKETREQKALTVEKAEKMSHDMQEKIEESKAVHRIEELTNEILGISKQTNMLALNASIESARAGEAGKGFAIVAERINELAGRTSKTAQEIQSISKTVIDCVDALSVTGNELMEFLSDKTLEGYDKLVDTANDYQNSSKIFFDMMQDFQEQFRVLEEKINSIEHNVQIVTDQIETDLGEVADATFRAEDLAQRMEEAYSDYAERESTQG